MTDETHLMIAQQRMLAKDTAISDAEMADDAAEDPQTLEELNRSLDRIIVARVEAEAAWVSHMALLLLEYMPKGKVLSYAAALTVAAQLRTTLKSTPRHVDEG